MCGGDDVAEWYRDSDARHDNFVGVASANRNKKDRKNERKKKIKIGMRAINGCAPEFLSADHKDS